MLDPAYVREHFDEVAARLESRGVDQSLVLAPFKLLDQQRREQLQIVETAKREQNEASEAVA